MSDEINYNMSLFKSLLSLSYLKFIGFLRCINSCFHHVREVLSHFFKYSFFLFHCLILEFPFCTYCCTGWYPTGMVGCYYYYYYYYHPFFFLLVKLAIVSDSPHPQVCWCVSAHWDCCWSSRVNFLVFVSVIVLFNHRTFVGVLLILRVYDLFWLVRRCLSPPSLAAAEWCSEVSVRRWSERTETAWDLHTGCECWGSQQRLQLRPRGARPSQVFLTRARGVLHPLERVGAHQAPRSLKSHSSALPPESSCRWPQVLSLALLALASKCLQQTLSLWALVSSLGEIWVRRKQGSSSEPVLLGTTRQMESTPPRSLRIRRVRSLLRQRLGW